MSPIKVGDCGLNVLYKSSDMLLYNENAIEEASELLKGGGILAIKGVGGYHLAVDACNEYSVLKLRNKKHRYAKPFAVMMLNMHEVEKYCVVSIGEKQLLESYHAPIVILKKNPSGDTLAYSLTMGLNTIGVMLPYTPLHKLILEKIRFPLVMTSGNISDEPICINDTDAQNRLNDIVDGFLYHNRPITNRLDDSVCFFGANNIRMIRRGRGFAQEPILINRSEKQILACGSFHKNTFCLIKNEHAFVSHHIGDLDNPLTYQYYKDEIEKYMERLVIKPVCIVKDLHPSFPLYADKQNLPVLTVQHHHAHIASVMAEYGLKDKVLGIVYDGTGLGNDGSIWGAEFLLADLRGYKRVGHLEGIPLPGGDLAVKNPFRSALGFIYKDVKYFSQYVGRLDSFQVKIVLKQIANRINTPLASSMGRLFDAVASIIDIRDSIDYEGQAAMELESIISHTDDYYEYCLENNNAGFCINVRKMFHQIYKNYTSGLSKGIISGKFHNTVVKFTVDITKKIRDIYFVNKIVISGGCFQNRYLLDNVNTCLKKEGFEVYIPSRVPLNDGGISLGQAAIATLYSSES